MKRKKFSQELFNENDPKARRIVKQWLCANGKDAVDAPDPYGPDLWIENKGYYVEVERKHNWNSENFPFPTVNIPQRKKKYLEIYGKVYYFVLSKSYSQAIIINGEHLKEEYLHEVRNKYVSSGEYFYQIPIKFCKIVEIGKSKDGRRNLSD